MILRHSGSSFSFRVLVFTAITACSLFTLGTCFVVEPMGLSGQYLPFGNYAKAGKMGQGVSWSSNLDSELQLRKSLCKHIAPRILYQYRYHNKTGTCHKLGEKGPCGDNMVFFGWQTNAVYGQCDCNYNDNGRALVYDGERNQCHFVYQRGYCEENEWLTFDKNWKPKCERNKCLGYYHQNNSIIPEGSSFGKGKTIVLTKAVALEYIPYEDKCVLLGETCEDKDPQWASLSHLSFEITFVKGAVNVRCAPAKYVLWRYPTPKLQCMPGSYLATSVKKCHPALEM